MFIAHAAFFVYTAEAQEEVKIEKTVVTSTLTPKEFKEVPGAFEVITAKQIKAMGAETAAEALEDAVSIDLDHVAGRGLIPQIRGLNNKRTLILIDGMRFATGFRDTTVDSTEFPTEIIKRIEIVRGPTSALYGSEGIGGVINIITKQAPEKLSGNFTTSYGMNTYGDAENNIIKAPLGNTLKNFGIIAAGHASITNEYDRHKDDSFTDIDDAGEDLLEVPEVKLNIRLCYDSPDLGLTANIRANYTGTQVIAPKFEDGSKDESGGYTVWDIYAAKDIGRNFNLFAGIDNMFNREMPYSSCRGAFFYYGLSAGF